MGTVKLPPGTPGSGKVTASVQSLSVQLASRLMKERCISVEILKESTRTTTNVRKYRTVYHYTSVHHYEIILQKNLYYFTVT